MSSVKSFKKNRKKPTYSIKGTKFSPNNFSLLTSTGLSALDTLLGGGIPIGSLLLIEEDQCGRYTEIIAKHFVAEGILSKHRIVLASQDTDLKKFLASLPGPPPGPPSDKKDKSDSESKGGNSTNDEITIAWRYKNLKAADSSISEKSSFGHKLQMNTLLDVKRVESADLVRFLSSKDLGNHPESNLSSRLHEILKESQHVVECKDKSQVIRLALLNLGSPCWDSKEIAPMLYSLRSWLRKSVAVCLVTVPSHLYKDNNEVWKWINFSDVCIKLESFAGTSRAKNHALKDYHGFFHIMKLPAFNSIVPHTPPSDLSFKLRRRKFLIERLSLPPEHEDTAARGVPEKKAGCGSGSSSTLDF